MRFKLKLEFLGEPPFVFPANYQYDLSLNIDKIIHFGSDKFTKWLNKKGYLDEQHRFNYFNFSNLKLNDHTQKNDRLCTNDHQAELLISLLSTDDIEPIFYDLFINKELRFGDKKNKVSLIVKDIEVLPMPLFKNTTNFRAVTPLVINHNGEPNNKNKKPKQLTPGDKDFERLFFKHLLSKYAGYVKAGLAKPLSSDFSKLKINCNSKPVSRIVTVQTDNHKRLSIKGYLFDFSISAPGELTRLGYLTGFGEYNTMGFGFSEII